MDLCLFLSFKGGIYFTIMAVMLFLIRIFIGKVTDQKGEAIFVYTCHMCMFIALFLIAFIPHNITFLLSAALSGYAFGGIEPALQSMAVSIAPPQRRGAANSTFLCAYDMGIGLGGGIAGVLIDMIGYNYMFAIIAIANILSILYCYWPKSSIIINLSFKNAKRKASLDLLFIYLRFSTG